MEIITVALSESGWRLDLFLAHYFPNYSRTHIRNAMMAGCVLICEEGADKDSGHNQL